MSKFFEYISGEKHSKVAVGKSTAADVEALRDTINKRELAKLLAPLYVKDESVKANCVSIAKLCDDVLDRSGNLLAYVREEAAAIRALGEKT